MEKMSVLMGKLSQQKVASGPVQQKKLVLFGWACLHEHPPFWQFIPLFSPFHAGVLRRTTPYVCNAFQWLWNLSTNLCLFLKFLRSVKKGPPSLNQARTELICYPAISLGLNSDILSILLVYEQDRLFFVRTSRYLCFKDFWKTEFLPFWNWVFWKFEGLGSKNVWNCLYWAIFGENFP